MTRTHVTMIALLVFAAVPLGAVAQPPEDGPQPEGPGPGRARMFLVLRIADALQLSEPDALKVSNVIRQADERRQELVKQRQVLEDKLRAALAKKPPDATDLTALINEGNGLDQKLAMVPEESFRELQKALTVEQQARLILFRRELYGEIRRAMQGRRRGAGARAGGRPE